MYLCRLGVLSENRAIHAARFSQYPDREEGSCSAAEIPQQPLRTTCIYRARMHVAIIPDGNRRWAKARGLPGTAGHAAAITRDRLLAFLKEAKALGVTHLTFWGFSTENWKREKEEVDALFRLIDDAIERMREDARNERIRFRWLGRRDRVPRELRATLEAFEAETEGHDGLGFQLCLDYGGRDELLRAANAAVAVGKQLDESGLAALLDTHGLPDPDMIIRTSGEQRLSGLFPWQGAYAELYFVPQHFPDFTPADLRTAVAWLGARQRRFGGN